MRASPLPASLFKKNRKRLLDALPEGALALISSNKQIAHNGDSTYPFMQNTSFYYLTGINEENAVIILSKQGTKETREILCLRESTPTEVLWMGSSTSLEDAAKISGIKQVAPIEQFDNLYNRETIHAKELYFLLGEHGREVPSQYSRNSYYNYHLAQKIRNRYPLHQHKRLAPILHPLRMIKQPEEVAEMEKAIAVTIQAYKHVQDFLRKVKDKPIFEYEIEAEIQREILRQGAEGLAFAPIIAGGERSCTLHYTQNAKPIKPDQHVLIDIGARLGYYHADLTRVFPVGEKQIFSRRTKAVYDAVSRVHDHAASVLRPGLTFKDYQKEVRSAMSTELTHLGLIPESSAGDSLPKDKPTGIPRYEDYFMHGISHFLGLEVHDVGEMSGTIEENMVLTVEPGIYIKSEGIGIRLENDFLITKSGARNLAQEYPIDRASVEQASS